jgi:uncharacterized protein YegP (UPF0339 family)
MAGMFEVFVDTESYFRFRLKAPDGTVMAVSTPFDSKAAAAAGIAAVRECAGTGLITDLCAGQQERPRQQELPRPALGAGSVEHAGNRQSGDHRTGEHRTAADHFRARAKALRRPAVGPRWTHAV